MTSERQFILDRAEALAPGNRRILAALCAGRHTIREVASALDVGDNQIGITLRRLRADGWVDFVAPGGARGPQQWTPTMQGSLRLPSRPEPWIVGEPPAFWWDCNKLNGGIAHPFHLRVVLTVHRLDKVAGARQATWDHPATLVMGASAMLSFGFQREHTGITLAEWARGTEAPAWLAPMLEAP